MSAVRFSDPFKRITNVGWGGSKLGYVVIWPLFAKNDGSGTIPTLTIVSENIGMNGNDGILLKDTEWDPGGIPNDGLGNWTQLPGSPIVQGTPFSTISRDMHRDYLLWKYSIRRFIAPLSGNTTALDAVTVINLDNCFEKGPNAPFFGPDAFLNIHAQVPNVDNLFGNSIWCGYVQKTQTFVPSPKTGDVTTVPPVGVGLVNLVVAHLNAAHLEFSLIIRRQNPGALELETP